MAIDPRVEDSLRRSLRDIAQGTGGAIDPDFIRHVTATVERALPKFAAISATPCVVAPPDVRRFVRAIFERKIPQVSVISFREVEPSFSLRVVETLSSPAGSMPQVSARSA
jgi:type III secretory pathway component EscV